MTQHEHAACEPFEDAPDYAANYLRTYFGGDPDPDEQVVMRFLAHEFTALRDTPALLEVGCGPVVNHILSAAPRVSSIDLADYRADNLRELEKWRNGEPGAHDWTRFTRFALTAEGLAGTEAEVLERERETRRRIRSVRTCDLRLEEPLGIPARYDVVCCFYTTEQAATSREDWPTVFTNLARLVAPGGRLLACAVGYTEHYVVYDSDGEPHRYSVPRLTPEDFESALERNGFDRANSVVRYEHLTGQESEGVYGVILVSATKRA